MGNRIHLKRVAEKIGVTEQTIHNWCSNGALGKKDFPRGVPIGNKHEWDEDDIDAWLNARFAVVRAQNAERLAELNGPAKKKGGR